MVSFFFITPRSEEITNKVKSYLWQTSKNKPSDLKAHVEEQITAYLLNTKAWEFLSEMKLDENAENLGCRLVSLHVSHVIRFSDRVDLWVIKIKST